MKKEPRFFEITYNEAEGVFCYRSGLAVYEECFFGGALISGGYNAAGYPLNVLSNCNTRLSPDLGYEPSVFHLEIDGQSAHYDLSLCDFSVEKSEQAAHGVITLAHGTLPVRIKVHTVVDGSAVFIRYLEIESLSDQPLRINRMELLSGGIERMNLPLELSETTYEKKYSVGYFECDAWGREGDFAWHNLPFGKTVVDGRFDRNRYRHPMVLIRNNVMGSIYFSQIGWSGGYRFTVDHAPLLDHKRSDRKDSFLCLKAELTGYAPLLDRKSVV